MGRKNSSVPIDTERIEKLLKEKKLTKSALAKTIGYSREAISKAINQGFMEMGMLEKISEVLDRMPAYLQGKTTVEHPYSDYVFSRTWDEKTAFFRKWVELNENGLIVHSDEIPLALRKNEISDYCMKDFIKEFEEGNTVYSDDGVRLTDDGYDFLSAEVLWHLHRFLRDHYIKILIEKESED